MENHELNNLVKTISKLKKKLATSWKNKGAIENFGDKEVRILRDFYVGSNVEREAMNLINEFENWCMNYTGKE